MSKGRRGREGRKTRKKRVNEGSPYGQPGSLATRESLRDGVENTSELLKGKETGTNLSISSFQWSGLLVGHSLSASHLPCVVTEHTGQEPEHCQLERCRKPPIDKGTSMLVSSWGRGVSRDYEQSLLANATSTQRQDDDRCDWIPISPLLTVWLRHMTQDLWASL